jgi:hypothetical protein
VGSPVRWTATTGDHGASPVYQFRVGPVGGPSQVVQDFSRSDSFTWDPLRQGTYTVQVTVKDGFDAPAGETATATYTANSRVVGDAAVASPTTNPLVALYSAPPAAGASLVVQYRPANVDQAWSSTAPAPVVPGQSTNVLVAGLLPGTTYLMRHVLDDGTASDPIPFQTGALPAYLTFPTFKLQQAPTAATDLSQSVVLHMGITPPPGTVNTLATDLLGDVIWYYDPVANGFPSYATNLVPGGTVLLIGGNQDGVGGGDAIREVDLAGDTLRSTNIDAVNAQLAALGVHPITDFSHELLRLPNGGTAVLATTPRTVNLNGTPTRYQGDMVLVLDSNFQVAWAWDPFRWLDTNRLPVLGEGPTDWLHANSISWSPADGNLIVSLRAQDWVVKVQYADGLGDGHVVWRLGPGGDFALNPPDPNLWFSHQHDVQYVDPSTLVLFDNGNTRQARDPQAHSRGQVLVLDEGARRATLVANVDLGSYALAVGGAQRLPNGNLVFESGFAQQTIEVRPDGTRTYVLKMNMPGLEYRSDVLASLYGPAGQFVEPTGPSSAGFVDLSGAFNRVGMVSDATPFAHGGLDGVGSALPAGVVGPSLLVGGGYIAGPADAPNVVAALGQVIPLPATSAGALKILAAGALGPQPNQPFVVTYTDGTYAVFALSLSDWGAPRSYPGEATALTVPYRDLATGGAQPGAFRLYEYTFALNPAKVVRSLTLPWNPGVEVFAAKLTPDVPAGATAALPPAAAGRLTYQSRLAAYRLLRLARLQASQARPAVVRAQRAVSHDAGPPRPRPATPGASAAVNLLARRQP